MSTWHQRIGFEPRQLLDLEDATCDERSAQFGRTVDLLDLESDTDERFGDGVDVRGQALDVLGEPGQGTRTVVLLRRWGCSQS